MPIELAIQAYLVVNMVRVTVAITDALIVLLIIRMFDAFKIITEQLLNNLFLIEYCQKAIVHRTYLTVGLSDLEVISLTRNKWAEYFHNQIL